MARVELFPLAGARREDVAAVSPGLNLSAGAFERGAVPFGEVGGGLVSSLKKCEQRLVGILRGADDLVGQHELTERRVIERALRLDGVLGETGGLRIGISVKRRLFPTAHARRT